MWRVSFLQETGLELQEESREPFFELNRILTALKARDLGPALQWAEENREKLRAQVSVNAYFDLCYCYTLHLEAVTEFPQTRAIGGFANEAMNYWLVF